MRPQRGQPGIAGGRGTARAGRRRTALRAFPGAAKWRPGGPPLAPQRGAAWVAGGRKAVRVGTRRMAPGSRQARGLFAAATEARSCLPRWPQL